jgi:hypothetical protein
MNIYRCELLRITTEYGGHRLQVTMLEDHKELGGQKGEVTITSQIKFVDFERKYAITRNSMYMWG